MKPGGDGDVGGLGQIHQFHRHIAAQPFVRGPVHLAHAAPPQAGMQTVPLPDQVTVTHVGSLSQWFCEVLSPQHDPASVHGASPPRPHPAPPRTEPGPPED
jgi:hypothetical protein